MGQLLRNTLSVLRRVQEEKKRIKKGKDSSAQGIIAIFEGFKPRIRY